MLDFAPPLQASSPPPPQPLPFPHMQCSQKHVATDNMLPRMLFLRALHVGGREVLRGRPWGRPPLPLGGGGQHHGWCCLTKGMTSGDQIARAFVGFLGLRGHR